MGGQGKEYLPCPPLFSVEWRKETRFLPKIEGLSDRILLRNRVSDIYRLVSEKWY